MQYDLTVDKSIVGQLEGKDRKLQIINLHKYSAWVLIFFSFSACTHVTPSSPLFSSPTTDTSLTTANPTEPAKSTRAPTKDPGIEVDQDETLVHLWALRGAIDTANEQLVATGTPEDDEGCGTPGFPGEMGSSGEVLLALSYAPSILPSEINLWFDGIADEILRIEVMNASTGLGREIYSTGFSIDETSLVDHACGKLFNIPINIEFDIDTIFISLSSLDAAGRMDSVELVGNVEQFQDALVYWRVPLTAAPVSVAVDRYNQVFIAAENNSIYKYDIEGNLLAEIPYVTDGLISDIVFDRDDNLIISDMLFGTYIILYPSGEKLVGGGDAPTLDVAVQPDNGKLFLLDDLGGPFYLVPYFPDTDLIINPLPLDAPAYTGLVFSPENQLFTIHPDDGFLVELDPITGLEISSIPLKSAEYVDALPVELTIDDKGNFYVLFEKNEGNTAIAILDPYGTLTRRVGVLTSPVAGDWPEGSYYKPRSVAVTPDGRFALIVDGDAGTYYLTCLLLSDE